MTSRVRPGPGFQDPTALGGERPGRGLGIRRVPVGGQGLRQLSRNRALRAPRDTQLMQVRRSPSFPARRAARDSRLRSQPAGQSWNQQCPRVRVSPGKFSCTKIGPEVSSTCPLRSLRLHGRCLGAIFPEEPGAGWALAAGAGVVAGAGKPEKKSLRARGRSE